MNQPQINPFIVIFVILVYAWTILWKSVALWKAANNKQRNWFVVLVILSTINLAGIPELIYLFKFSKKKLTFEEIKSWLPKKN
ncbi:MAG: hypothetical protein A2857_05260 [Candidatus Levybacteria bacterium RIFCSPHIGHO2_01_FULL_36_15]|nr:MAG: hypothetical protein A2857_05260 [Candidatus Levybacteria bacterium RIFCSPHIGHO2_01_FULL_36_15]OGH38465.1 MAG: hypothetical protein A2905_01510 [Candidatus Levybacteria bacterium RIFCSPLOWO2_01_FULL_36_10]